MKTASLLSVGCSATGANHIPCLEDDARFVADNFARAFSRFDNSKKFPVRNWETQTLTGKIIKITDFSHALNMMPVKPVMLLYISSHGFTKKISGKNRFCNYFGDENNWLPFNFILKLVNKICADPRVKHFQIVIDACFSGLSKKEIKRLKSKIKFFENRKKILLPKRIDPITKELFTDTDTSLDIKSHKKISILNVCKGKQTSFASFTPDDFSPASTNGHSLGTNSWITAMNWFYSYAPGLTLNIAGKKCKPRSQHAIMTLAQRRVNHTIKSLGLREWLNYEPKTIIQKYNSIGKLIFY